MSQSLDSLKLKTKYRPSEFHSRLAYDQIVNQGNQNTIQASLGKKISFLQCTMVHV